MTKIADLPSVESRQAPQMPRITKRHIDAIEEASAAGCNGSLPCPVNHDAIGEVENLLRSLSQMKNPCFVEREEIEEVQSPLANNRLVETLLIVARWLNSGATP